jgi:signal peptidase I
MVLETTAGIGLNLSIFGWRVRPHGPESAVIPEPDADAPRRSISSLRLYIGGVVLLIVGLTALAIYQSYWVPKVIISSSMYPTLRKGEFVFVDCRRGQVFGLNDVVMLEDPERPDGPVTKRIIAREGQTVRWDGRRLAVGEAELTQVRPVAEVLAAEPDVSVGMNRPAVQVEVGPDEVFVLGDNWGKSYDSFDYGPVPVDRLIGVVRYVYWPFSQRRAVH